MEKEKGLFRLSNRAEIPSYFHSEVAKLLDFPTYFEMAKEKNIRDMIWAFEKLLMEYKELQMAEWLRKIVEMDRRGLLVAYSGGRELLGEMAETLRREGGEQVMRELKQLARRGKGASFPTLMLAYLVILKDEELLEFCGGRREKVMELLLNLDKAEKVIQTGLLRDPLRGELVESLSLTPGELLTGKKGESIYLGYWMNQEQMGVLAKYLKSEQGWQERLTALEELLAAWGWPVVDDSRINQALLMSYWSGLTEPQKKRLLELDYEEQLGVLMGLRKRARGSLRQIRGYLAEVVVGGGKAASLAEKAQKWQLNWLEDKRHPLAHLYPTIGFEIEHELPDEVIKRNWVMLEAIGFHLGRGGVTTRQVGAEQMRISVEESSPGPFRRPETAELVFLSLVKSGLIDMYEQHGQTVHLNLGLKSKMGAVGLVRGLQATLWAYHPRFEAQISGTAVHSQAVKIYGRPLTSSILEDVTNFQYLEFKEFSLQTVGGFLRLMRTGSLLGAALNQWQRARREGEEMTEDQERLAGVWQEYQAELRSGFEQLNLAEVLSSNNLLMGTALAFARQLEAAMPDRLSRFKPAGAIKVEEIIGRGGRRYPNLVSFARAVAIKYVRQVQEIMDQVGEVCM